MAQIWLPRKDGLKQEQLAGQDEFLATERRILIMSEVINFGGSGLIEALMALDTISADPIKLFITSPGGALVGAFSICDAMSMLRSPIYTVGRICASAAILPLVMGTAGHRYMTPRGQVMLHLPYGAAEGTYQEARIQAEELRKLTERIADILISRGVKRTQAQVLADIDREFWMDAREAIDYGLADKILDAATYQGWISGS